MIPEPGSSVRCSASQPSRASAVGSRSADSRRLSRSSGPRSTSVPAPLSKDVDDPSTVSRGSRCDSWSPSEPVAVPLVVPVSSTSATSRTTRSFAVAVVASTGTPSGRSASSVRSRR